MYKRLNDSDILITNHYFSTVGRSLGAFYY